MNRERLHEHRNRRIAEVSGLIRQRDQEVASRGAAREQTAKKIARLDREVRQIEHELRSD